MPSVQGATDAISAQQHADLVMFSDHLISCPWYYTVKDWMDAGVIVYNKDKSRELRLTNGLTAKTMSVRSAPVSCLSFCSVLCFITHTCRQHYLITSESWLVSVLIFLDLRTSFNSINHCILLQQTVRSFGIKITGSDWLESNLSPTHTNLVWAFRLHCTSFLRQYYQHLLC